MSNINGIVYKTEITMRKLLMTLMMLFALLACTPALSQDAPAEPKPAIEAPAEAPAAEAPADAPKAEEAPVDASKAEETSDEPKEEAASWFAANFHVLVSGLVGILVALGLWGRGRQWLLDKAGARSAKLFEFVEASVVEVYHGYVRDIKKNPENKSGSLGKKQAAEARSKAIAKIKDKAKKNGLRIASEILLPVLIEKAITRLKKGSTE